MATGFQQSPSNIPIIGDEELDPDAIGRIEGNLRPDEKVLAYSAFDWGQKVIAVTDQRVIVADSEQFHLRANLTTIKEATREGRTLVIRTRDRDHKYRMGHEPSVAELQYLITRAPTMAQQPDSIEHQEILQHSAADPQSPDIAERVKFWEEQDAINQALIPRVIRQHELLTAHVADHENLPLVAANAIREAMTAALEEQQAQHDAAIAAVQRDAEEQARTHAEELRAIKEEREQQSQAHARELEDAREERQEQSRQHSEEIQNLHTSYKKRSRIQLALVALAILPGIAALALAIAT